ncbi:A-kinase anchor protein 4 [Manis javanica]|nr:A-kinase anchor protein 4 [Manis javanica]
MQLQVDFYSPTGQQDQERKVICFIDMSTLNVEDKNSKKPLKLLAGPKELKYGRYHVRKVKTTGKTAPTVLTLKVHSSGKPILAGVVLKRVLLKHTKEIVSDLTDYHMKNLHNTTGDLMTDSDFVSAIKRNLFNPGKQNAADIMEAMLSRLKLLSDGSFNCDALSEGENKHSEPRTNKAVSMSKRPDKGEEQSQDMLEFDFISGLKQMNWQFIDQLVESVMKLCLVMAKYSNNGAALAELEEQAELANNHNFQVGGPRCSHDVAMPQNYQDSLGSEVIVNNQCSTSNLQKQLQAILQWMAASQFNVPMLYFMGDNDGQLEKLPEVSDKAAEKGYSI